MKNRRLYGDTILYRGVLLIRIDYTHDALYWCNRHGMAFCETITLSDTGEKFDIWENKARGLSCAIPA